MIEIKIKIKEVNSKDFGETTCKIIKQEIKAYSNKETKQEMEVADDILKKLEGKKITIENKTKDKEIDKLVEKIKEEFGI